jgi:hypothetical protein
MQSTPSQIWSSIPTSMRGVQGLTSPSIRPAQDLQSPRLRNLPELGSSSSTLARGASELAASNVRNPLADPPQASLEPLHSMLPSLSSAWQARGPYTYPGGAAGAAAYPTSSSTYTGIPADLMLRTGLPANLGQDTSMYHRMDSSMAALAAAAASINQHEHVQLPNMRNILSLPLGSTSDAIALGQMFSHSQGLPLCEPAGARKNTASNLLNGQLPLTATDRDATTPFGFNFANLGLPLGGSFQLLHSMSASQGHSLQPNIPGSQTTQISQHGLGQGTALSQHSLGQNSQLSQHALGAQNTALPQHSLAHGAALSRGIVPTQSANILPGISSTPNVSLVQHHVQSSSALPPNTSLQLSNLSLQQTSTSSQQAQQLLRKQARPDERASRGLDRP